MALIGKIFIFILTAISCFAILGFIIQEFIKNESIKTIATIILFLFSLLTAYNIASDAFNLKPKVIEYKRVGHTGQGCCSHHGGVCGCSGGNVKCCDGTSSDTCECGY